MITQGSGNRYTGSLLAGVLSRLVADHGDPLTALDHVTLAIRNFHDAGNTTGGAQRPGGPRRPFPTGLATANRRPPSPGSPPAP